MNYHSHLLMSLILNITFLSALILAQSIQWQQLSGPHGGSIYSIVHDSSGNIYANTIGSTGPFKSTDDGETWISIMNGLTPVNNGGFHPLNINSNGDLFIGGAHSTVALGRSTDGGSSWEPLNNLNPGSSIICIAFDSNENVYVGTGTGIYKSTDNGDNWSQYGMNGSQTEAIAFNDSGHIFAGTSYAVYRSTDDGANWTQLPTGGGTRTVAVAPNGYVFAGCQENAGILRSTDNGDTWTYVYPQTVSIRFASTPFFDTNGDIYFPTWGKSILKSTDNGDNWTELNNNLRIYARAVDKNISGNFFTGYDHAIFKSTNAGSNWYSVGINISSVRKIAINSNDDIFASSSGISRSTDKGQSWRTINNGIDNYDIQAITVNNNGDIYAGASPQNWSVNNLYRSTDNGENWAPVLSFPLNWDVAITGLASGPNGEIAAVGGGYDVRCHLSTDNGVSWTNILYNLPFSPSEVAINSQGDVFVSGGNSGLWRLPVNDTIWVQAGPYVVYEFFIASNNYIYTKEAKSTDNGQTWTPIGVGAYIYSFAENSVGHLFFGTNQYGQGVYRSFDFGETWELINNALPSGLDINTLAVDSEDYLYAGTGGKSMFKTTTPTVTLTDDPTLIAYYPFNGNADDESGYGNHGTVMGPVLTSDRFGVDSSAYEFDGLSTYITVPNSPSLQSPTTELTQIAWINIYSWGSGGFWGPVLMKSNSSANAFQYRLSVGTGGINTAINNWENAVNVFDTLNFNNWYMVASTLKNDTVKVYVNGVYKGEGTLTGPISLDTKPLEIGRDTPGSTEVFHGKIDDIRIYNRALSESEIDTIYGGLVNISSENKGITLRNFMLYQNYPNPFNPTTTIQFGLPKAGRVKITLFNLLGQEVGVLLDEIKPAGSHKIQVDCSNLGNGIYFYRMQASGYVQTRKLMVVK